MSDFDDDKTRVHVPITKGTMITHYRIEKKIGAGGMGEVYLAEDTKLNRNVALKFLPQSLIANDELRARFQREAQAAAKLDHPNIVTVYEVGEHENRPFIAMQYIDGKTLHHYCHAEKLSLETIISLMTQIADGLSKAHTNGIIHRDIKSVNILVNKDYRAKILDFGLAAIQGADDLTKDGSTLGTFAYMSPEQASGKDVDFRTDIYSFGVVIYELLTGVSPFKGSSDVETIQNVINKIPENLNNHNSKIPTMLNDIVLRSLEKDPANRFQSTDGLLEKLHEINLTPKSSDDSDEKPSIAVLPFANMSTDPENEFFADGLSEELLNVLAKIPELKVTGRTSSFAFKGKNEDLRVIGNKLGVGTILEGSVRKAGNRVRITAQLVKTSDGFHLWSDTYDRVIEDIFAVQDEIAAAVADEMHVTLLGKTRDVKVSNPESYELSLKAQQISYSWTTSAMQEAIDLYKKALEIDPENAKAWAGLGRVYFIQCAFGFDDHNKTYRNAKKAVLKAIEYDNQSADAYEVQGWIRLSLEFHFDEAEIAFKKALELAPNNSRIVSGVGTYLVLIKDEVEEGLKLLELARQLDPLNPEAYMNLGKINTTIGQYEKSMVSFHKALELSEGMAGIYTWISGIHYIQGRYEESLKFAKLEESEGHRLQALAIAYHGLGDKNESDAAIEAMLNMPNADAWAFQLAMIYGERNEVDEAFKWLEIAYRDRDAGLPQAKVAYYLRNLHSDPRWLDFLERIGFDV